MENRKPLLLTDKIYLAVRHRAIEGQFLGRENIPTRVLESEFQCAFAPIGDALKRLTSEGYLRRDPRGAHFIRHWEEKDITNIFSSWGTIMGHCAEVATQSEKPAVARGSSGNDEPKPTRQARSSATSAMRGLATFYRALSGNASPQTKIAADGLMIPALLHRALRSLTLDRLAFHTIQVDHINAAILDRNGQSASQLVHRQIYDFELQTLEDIRTLNAVQPAREVSFKLDVSRARLIRPTGPEADVNLTAY